MNPRPARKDTAAVHHDNPGHVAAMTRGYLTAATRPPGTPMHEVPPGATICREDVDAETWDVALATCARFAGDHPQDVAWLPPRIIGYHLRMSQQATTDHSARGFQLLRRSPTRDDPTLWREFNRAMQRLHTHAQAMLADAIPARCP